MAFVGSASNTVGLGVLCWKWFCGYLTKSLVSYCQLCFYSNPELTDSLCLHDFLLTKSPASCRLLEFILTMNSAYTLPAWLPFFIKNPSSLTCLKLFKKDYNLLLSALICCIYVDFCFLLSVWVHPPGVWSELYSHGVINCKDTKAKCRHLKIDL